MEDVFVKADALAKAVGECEDYKNLLAAGEKLKKVREKTCATI